MSTNTETPATPDSLGDALGAMASEDEVEAGGCTLVTKTWGEWAAKEGRGYMGGIE